MLLVLLITMVSDLREGFTPLCTWLARPNGKTTMFADMIPKLSASHADVEFLTESTSVFIYDTPSVLKYLKYWGELLLR